MAENFRAIIFDFNGVIIDDEPLHLELLRRVLLEEGMTFTENDYHDKYLGCDDRRCFHRALTDHNRPADAANPKYIESLIARKTRYYHDSIGEENLLFAGIPELIAHLASQVPLAIASGALRDEIEVALTRGNIRQHFHLIVASEDVTRSKPDPEGYLTALNGLQLVIPDLAPTECLVIEDSVAGVEAAKSAGMQCLAVTTSYPPEKLRRADAIVPRLSDWLRIP